MGGEADKPRPANHCNVMASAAGGLPDLLHQPLPDAAKVAFEKYFLAKVRNGRADTFFEKAGLRLLGLEKLREVRAEK